MRGGDGWDHQGVHTPALVLYSSVMGFNLSHQQGLSMIPLAHLHRALGSMPSTA